MSKGVGLKSQLRAALKTRLIVASLVFAIIGWCLLGVVIFARIFGGDLSGIEKFVGSPSFVWGLRIVIIIVLITLLRQNAWLDKAWHNEKVRQCVYTSWIAGLLGWLVGFIDLILPK